MSQEKNTEWYQHEALDRTHMLLCMLEEAYGREVDGYHPGIHNKECKKLVKKASKALAELYQKVGDWEERPCPKDNGRLSDGVIDAIRNKSVATEILDEQFTESLFEGGTP